MRHAGTNFRITFLIAAALTLFGSVAAQEPVMVNPFASPLGGPFVFKVDWQDFLLKTGDLNNDGREDWFTINRGKSLMSLYVSKPAAPGAPLDEAFELREIVVEKFVMGAWVADVTGDGRLDILLSGNPERLEVMIQDEAGRLLPPDERDPECQFILLDAAGEMRPWLYGFKDNRITQYSISGRAHFEEMSEVYGTATPRGEPVWMDVDGDGVQDVVFLDATKPDRLIVRRRGADGRLMPEQNFTIGTNVSLAGLTRWGSTSAILAIDAKTRVLKALQYAEDKDFPTAPAARMGSPLALGFDRESHSSKTFMELGDFNADGRQDILLVAPEAGNLRLFYASDTVFEARKFPAFEGIIKARFVPPTRQNSPPMIAVVSKSERVIAFSQCHADNRIDFPQPAVFDIEPINFEVADVDGSGRPDFIFLGKDSTGQPRLRLYRDPEWPRLDSNNYVVIDAAPAPPAADPAASPTPAPGAASIPELPADVRVLDLNQDDRPDLALFFDFSKPRLFLQTPEGEFAPARLSKSVEEAIVANMMAGNTFSAALPQSPHRLTFLARANFLRAFSLNADNAPVIYQQFNGKNNRSTIERAAILHRDKGREAVIALLDKYNKTLTLYHFDAEEWKVARHLDMDDASWVDMTAGDLTGDGNDDLLLLANDRLVICMAGETPREMNTVMTLKSDVDDGYYALVEVLPLGLGAATGQGSGGATGENILVIENKEHLLEVFDIKGETPSLERLFRFKIFSGDEEGRPESGPQKFAPAEPRNLKTADVNGDGRPDLLVLVHDRVIVYPGK